MLIIDKKKGKIPGDFRKRRGKFSVSYSLIKKPSETILKFLSNFVIVRAELRYDIDAIDYTALSVLFSPVDFGDRTPEYQIRVTEHEDGTIDIKAIQVPDERGKKLLRLLRKLDG